MAGSVEEVEQLLEDLRAAAHPVAVQELAELRACATRAGAPEAEALRAWDVSFWAEVRRQEAFALYSEALRPWFPLPRVLDGLFGLCNRLFGIRISAADGTAPVWHADVRYFRVDDAGSGEPIAAFFLDPYSRPDSKRGGAWMDECLVRSVAEDGRPVLPVAYLVCNQSPPVGEIPSLMTFEEVETLFHEFGHGLQHMLTTVERPQAAGINNVEWDAVELPSQFMENWCYDRATLLGMARHWQSGETLPEAEFAKLQAARTFMTGAATLRKVHLALTDLRLHSQWTPEGGRSPEALRREIAAHTTVIAPIPDDALLCSFGHIFAGGYAAGYYSYKWAEVLSADAFSAFEDVGLDNEDALQATGRRFRATVLGLGGSRHPAEVFEAFRGRQPLTGGTDPPLGPGGGSLSLPCSGSQQRLPQRFERARVAEDVLVQGGRQRCGRAHWQHAAPGRHHHLIPGRVVALAVHLIEAAEIAVELAHQRAAQLQLGDASHQPGGPRLGNERALLRAADADEAPRTPLPALQLDPGAPDHPAHREAEQVDRLIRAEGCLDRRAKPLGQRPHAGGAEPVRQVGDQQRVAGASQLAGQPFEQPRGVPEAVDENKGGKRRHRAILMAGGSAATGT